MGGIVFPVFICLKLMIANEAFFEACTVGTGDFGVGRACLGLILCIFSFTLRSPVEGNPGDGFSV